MKCPRCNNQTKIYNSRQTQHATQTWRRHGCSNCDYCFTTREKIDWNHQTSLQHTDGTQSPYQREVLLMSLLTAGSRLSITPGQLSDLCDNIELRLQRDGFFFKAKQPTGLLVTAILAILSRYDRHLALQFLNDVYNGKPPARLLRPLTASL